MIRKDFIIQSYEISLLKAEGVLNGRGLLESCMRTIERERRGPNALTCDQKVNVSDVCKYLAKYEGNKANLYYRPLIIASIVDKKTRGNLGHFTKSFLSTIDVCGFHGKQLYKLYGKLSNDIHTWDCNGPHVRINLKKFSEKEQCLLQRIVASAGLKISDTNE